MKKQKLTLEIKVRGMRANNDIDIMLSFYEEERIQDMKHDVLNLIRPFIREAQSYVITIKVFKDILPLTFNEDGQIVRECVESTEILATYTFLALGGNNRGIEKRNENVF